MDTQTLSTELAQRSIMLALDEQGKLTYTAPKGAMTPELAQAVKEHKTALLAELSSTLIEHQDEQDTAVSLDISRLFDKDYDPPIKTDEWIVLHMSRYYAHGGQREYPDLSPRIRAAIARTLNSVNAASIRYQAPIDLKTEHQEALTPPAPLPASDELERKQWVLVFADVHAGRAITEQGVLITFPAHARLSVMLAAINAVTPCNRILLCGKRPGDGTAESFLEWLIDPGMLADYTTDPKRGHYLDPLEPDKATARYMHRISRRGLDIRRITSWLGDDDDITVEQARETLAMTTLYLRTHYRRELHLSGTPATTFRNLWTASNRMTVHQQKDEATTTGKRFEPLPEEIRTLIAEHAGQGRIEYFPENCTGKIGGVFYYDGIFTYAKYCWGLPTELKSHDFVNEYAGMQPAIYRIRYTVPAGWDHVGVFMTPRGHDEWQYPGKHMRGESFETWVNGAELHACIMHKNYYQAPVLPDDTSKDEQRRLKEEAYRRATLIAFAAWNIEILERIVFKSESESAVTRPLVTIRDKMVEIRDHMDRDSKQDPGRAPIYKLARGAIRNLLLHGIGAFAQKRSKRTYILLDTDPAPLGYIDYKELDAHIRLYQVPMLLEADELSHPEWPAFVWARCRADMTRQALELSYETIMNIRTDAIATATYQAQLERGTKVGELRRKWAVQKSLVAPKNFEEFDELQRKVLNRGTSK